MGDAEVAMQMLLYIEKETQLYPRYTYIVFVGPIDVIFNERVKCRDSSGFRSISMVFTKTYRSMQRNHDINTSPFKPSQVKPYDSMSELSRFSYRLNPMKTL